jgi:hypothetical protein
VFFSRNEWFLDQAACINNTNLAVWDTKRTAGLLDIRIDCIPRVVYVNEMFSALWRPLAPLGFQPRFDHGFPPSHRSFGRTTEIKRHSMCRHL